MSKTPIVIRAGANPKTIHTFKKRKSLPRGECSRYTVRCFTARDYSVDIRPCCRRHIVNILQHTGDALDELGVSWWADYGTLLGAARHSGIVPWDKDADIGVLFRDWKQAQKIASKLQITRGYAVRVRQRRESIKVCLSMSNHTNVDVFFWRERPDGTLYRKVYASVDQFKGREFPKDWLFPLSTLPFEGRHIPVPREWEKLLRRRYGDWETPIRANNDGRRRNK